MRRRAEALARLVLRIFFRDIQVSGLEKVPAEGPVIFVINHPNGLLDPVFALCLVPRPISFLAKWPLFRMPVVGWFVRLFDSIPVYRMQDSASRKLNRELNQKTFEASRALLARGGTIALFPEGVSHNEPTLLPLKSGAARIALGAHIDHLKIVPVGLFYTAKETFRSSALMIFGEPFAVMADGQALEPPAENENEDGDGEPSRLAVRHLTDRIRESLGEVTLQADSRESLHLAELIEYLLQSRPWPGAGPVVPLDQKFALRRRILRRYPELRRRFPEEARALEGELLRFERRIRGQGGDPRRNLTRPTIAERQQLRRELALLALLSPVAFLGWVTHYPAYRCIGWIARKYAKGEDDLIATIKVMAAVLFFPLSWVGWAVLTGVWAGPGAGVLAAGGVPFAGYACLVYTEHCEHSIGRLRSLLFFPRRKERYWQLRREQRKLRNRLLALGRRLDPQKGS